MDHTPALTLTAAQAAVAAARAVMLAAIRDDADEAATAAARAALDAARADLASAEDAEAARAQAAAAEAKVSAAAQAEADEAAAAGAVAQVDAFVAEAIAAVAPPADAPNLLPAPAMPKNVVRAAAEVARAAAALERANEPLLAAQADRRKLAERLALKEAAAAAIRARRLAGDSRDGDAAEMHLFDSDAAELRSALAEADVRVSAAQPDEHLIRLHRDAVAALAAAQDRAVLDGMVQRMQALDEAIVAGARALRAAGQRQQPLFNLASYWRASEDLRKVVQGWGIH